MPPFQAFVWVLGSSLGPGACMANTLPTEPPPQLSSSFHKCHVLSPLSCLSSLFLFLFISNNFSFSLSGQPYLNHASFLYETAFLNFLKLFLD